MPYDGSQQADRSASAVSVPVEALGHGEAPGFGVQVGVGARRAQPVPVDPLHPPTGQRLLPGGGDQFGGVTDDGRAEPDRIVSLAQRLQQGLASAASLPVPAT